MRKYLVMFLLFSVLVFGQAGTGWKPASGGSGGTITNNAAGGDSMTITPGLKTLTNNTSTLFAKLTMTSNSVAGGTVFYTLEDATTIGSISGSVNFTAIDVAGTITASVATPSNTAAAGGSAGFSLTSVTVVDGGSNILNLQAKALTTGGTDVLKFHYYVNTNGLFTVVSQ